MKVSVNLGMTICTDSESRNFARFGFEISDIDTVGDIEQQAHESVDAVLKVFTIANHGMEEAVVGALTDLSSLNPEGVRDELNSLRGRVDHVQHQLVPNVVEKVKELIEKVENDNNEGTD